MRKKRMLPLCALNYPTRQSRQNQLKQALKNLMHQRQQKGEKNNISKLRVGHDVELSIIT